MRKALLLTVLLLIDTVDLFAQKGRTFNVEKLSTPKTKVFATESYQAILEKLIDLDRQLPGDINVKHIDGDANIIAKSNLPEQLVTRGFHPFFEGMYAAYADHHPFTLSPDMMWLLISQGFAAHVNNNAEQLRHLFVDFEGKKTLKYETVEDMFRPDSKWDKAFASFGTQIAQYTGSQLTNAMTANFSTTTPITKIASQITLMNAVQAYFNYEMIIRGCGIPRITLEGTTKDWENVLSKTEALRKYQLDWWVDEMEPILKQFISASNRNIDKEFWRSMFSTHPEKGGCGGSFDIVDGWIVKFFPYDKKGNRMGLKSMSLSGAVMPNEMLKVDLECIDEKDSNNVVHTSLELWAGFVGLDQDSKTYGLKPRIGWMIRKKDPYREAIVNRLANSNKDGGAVVIRVDNVPRELYKIGPVKKLVINFFGNIRIPDEMAAMQINDMTLNGTINQPEVNRIVKLFPNTVLHINGESYNQTANK